MEKPNKTGEIKPTENRRVKTSFNLLKIKLDAASKICTEIAITQTAAIDEALSDWIAKMTNTTDIDNAIAKTNNYIFQRDLEILKSHLPKTKIEKFSAFQIAHIYSKLKDNDDRIRSFEALGLTDQLKQMDAMNRELEKASIFKDSTFKGYNSFTLANELRAELTPLQQEYLNFKIGNDAYEALKKQRPNIFPKTANQATEKESLTTEEEAFDETTMNPALPTVLSISGLSQEAWGALTNAAKKQIHDAVRDGKTDIAKKLAKTAITAIPLIL